MEFNYNFDSNNWDYEVTEKEIKQFLLSEYSDEGVIELANEYLIMQNESNDLIDNFEDAVSYLLNQDEILDMIKVEFEDDAYADYVENFDNNPNEDAERYYWGTRL